MLRIVRSTALAVLAALTLAPLANAAGTCSGVLDRTMTAIDDKSVRSFESAVEPGDPRLVAAIEAELAAR